MAHQANPEENFNDKFQWNKSKVKTFTKTDYSSIVADMAELDVRLISI